MNPTPSQFLQWLRWPNLLIVSLTLALIRYGLVAPALHREGLFLSMDTLDFVFLTLYTLIITFAGYVINDLHDQETDAINKPHRRAVGVWIMETKARAVYLVLVLTGALLALYLDWRETKGQWIWIYAVLVFLVWLYSRHLKGSVLWGNFLVSLLCTAVVLLVPFAEKEVLTRLQEGQQLMFTVYFYAVFAGVSNLLREIIKDAEDREGDAKSRLNTLAVMYGLPASKKTALWVATLLFGFMLLFFLANERVWTELTGFALLTLPFLLIILFGLLKKNAETINWKKLSRMAKLLMLGGLLGLLFLL